MFKRRSACQFGMPQNTLRSSLNVSISSSEWDTVLRIRMAIMATVVLNPSRHSHAKRLKLTWTFLSMVWISQSTCSAHMRAAPAAGMVQVILRVAQNLDCCMIVWLFQIIWVGWVAAIILLTLGATGAGSISMTHRSLKWQTRAKLWAPLPMCCFTNEETDLFGTRQRPHRLDFFRWIRKTQCSVDGRCEVIKQSKMLGKCNLFELRTAYQHLRCWVIRDTDIDADYTVSHM